MTPVSGRFRWLFKIELTRDKEIETYI